MRSQQENRKAIQKNLTNKLNKMKERIQQENRAVNQIVLPTYYILNEDGSITYDFEMMAEEFENKLSELDDSVVVMCSVKNTEAETLTPHLTKLYSHMKLEYIKEDSEELHDYIKTYILPTESQQERIDYLEGKVCYDVDYIKEHMKYNTLVNCVLINPTETK